MRLCVCVYGGCPYYVYVEPCSPAKKLQSLSSWYPSPFIRLCKIKYYNNCLFYNVQRNFIAQTGDPTNTGKGGESVYGVLYGEQARFFEDEIRPALKHKKKGMVGMASECRCGGLWVARDTGPDKSAGECFLLDAPCRMTERVTMKYGLVDSHPS